jgi:hypothetical protein
VTAVRMENGDWDYRRTCVEGPVFPAERLVIWSIVQADCLIDSASVVSPMVLLLFFFLLLNREARK